MIKKPTFHSLLTQYLSDLRKVYSAGKGTEMTGRTPLENFLGGCRNLWNKGIDIQQETQQVESNVPDFKISINGVVVGYVETKTLGANCFSVAESEQIKKYKELNENILITNYHEFYWLKGKKLIALCGKDALLDNVKNIDLDKDKCEQLEKQLRSFLFGSPGSITKAKDLADRLSFPCLRLRDAIKERLEKQIEGREERDFILNVYEQFKEKVSREMSAEEMADAFAQTLGYGALLARLNKGETIDIVNMDAYTSKSFPLIREILKFARDLNESRYNDITWIIDQVFFVVNNFDIEKVKEDISFDANTEGSDPFIYFYEDFLKSYDAKQRVERGVYYTPASVARFIVRGIDDMLIDKFQIEGGLANHHKVTALDFACGTGTFLLEMIKRIFENSEKSLHEGIVKEHVCKNIYGFEILMAAYTVAHLKLTEFLESKGCSLPEGERLKIYLANTLERVDTMGELSDEQGNAFFANLAKESEEAQKIKKGEILVIMGNPPYSAKSMNKNTWVNEHIDECKFYINNERVKDISRNWKVAKDDYIKFLTFAKCKMDETERGVVGVITNHSFIDSITLPGLRERFKDTFDQIFIIDLHGNAQKKETPPNGRKDENIFGISPGVAISFFVKNRKIKKEDKGVFHADLWGNKNEKLEELENKKYKDIKWKKVACEHPHYFFCPFNKKGKKTYDKFISLTDIFVLFASGITTSFNEFAFSFKKEEIIKRVEDFSETGKNSNDLLKEHGFEDKNKNILEKIGNNLSALNGNFDFDKKIKECLVRPFDTRYCYYGKETIGRRRGLMPHLGMEGNISLVSVKQLAENVYNHAFMTDKITNSRITCSNRGMGYLFPLYIYRPVDSEDQEELEISKSDKLKFDTTNLFKGKERIENFYPAFRNDIDSKYNEHFPPEKIIFYIYAVLNSPYYRKKYLPFLKNAFPRIPFPADRKAFLALSSLGEEMKQTHLCQNIDSLSCAEINFPVKGDNIVTNVKFSEKKPEDKEHVPQSIYINDDQFFTPVSTATWNFNIGGYQVLKSYLKQRKGRVLSLDEIRHTKNIVTALEHTQHLMVKIDDAVEAVIAKAKM